MRRHLKTRIVFSVVMALGSLLIFMYLTSCLTTGGRPVPSDAVVTSVEVHIFESKSLGASNRSFQITESHAIDESVSLVVCHKDAGDHRGYEHVANVLLCFDSGHSITKCIYWCGKNPAIIVVNSKAFWGPSPTSGDGVVDFLQFCSTVVQSPK